MKVLFVAWEMDPFFKTGGLGDVIQSLPAALRNLEIDARVMMPLYRTLDTGRAKISSLGDKEVVFGEKEKVTFCETENPINQVPVYLLENRKYLDKVTRETFIFFQKAVVAGIKGKNILGWNHDIIHCHDHHAGLIPLLIKEKSLQIKTFLTIHN